MVCALTLLAGARFADQEPKQAKEAEAGWRFKDGSRVEAPQQEHSSILKALQKHAHDLEISKVGSPLLILGGVGNAWAMMHLGVCMSPGACLMLTLTAPCWT